MANFIISPYAISFDSIKNSLQTYIQSKPENETWKDFYVSGAGETIIEIAAALGAFYAYQFITNRRESYLSVAQNYSSVIGLAQNLGYSASRGENLQVSVNIVPNQTITLPKWSIIGSYSEYDVVVTEDIILNQGVAVNVPVIIGNSMVETLTVTTNKLTQFTFANDKVTDTYRLILNDTEVPSSTEIKDAINDKYITISNVYGAMDVFYLQEGKYTYKAGDKLYLHFIERNNLEWLNFSNSNLNIDYASQINESNLIKNKTDKESIDSIKIKAPIYHETSMVIRSRKDYSKYLQLRHQQIIAANDRDIYPGLIAITYIKEDGSNLTEEEKTYWLEQIEESRPSGVATAIIEDSIQINKTFNISLWKANDSEIDSTISDKIQKILATYENKFQVEIELNQIEHDIEKLEGVKIARVTMDEKKWQAGSLYNLFDIINVNNTNYYVTEFKYKTGGTEPEWPTELDETIQDGDVIWRRTNESQTSAISGWEANKIVKQYDYIKVTKDGVNYIFVCDGYINKTGTEEPDWTKDHIEDNQVIWEKVNIEYVGDNIWSENKIVNIGDLIKQNETVFRCCAFRAKTSNIEPNWNDIENGTVTDGNIQWNRLEAGGTIQLGWNEHVKLDKKIVIAG